MLGGAFVASSSSLILLALGAGFGLAVVSPWSSGGTSASTLGSLSIGWLFLVEVVASALGGYLTGRLRTKWAVIHTDEVYFRDTANGFLAWAVALVVGATFLASAAATMVGRVEQASTTPEATDSAAAVIAPGDNSWILCSDRIVQNALIPLHARKPGGFLSTTLAKDQMPRGRRDFTLAGLVSARTRTQPGGRGKEGIRCSRRRAGSRGFRAQGDGAHAFMVVPCSVDGSVQRELFGNHRRAAARSCKARLRRPKEKSQCARFYSIF